ncbi:DEAD/DEAH box RNA helicase family protein [Prunus dulcis]|uniref:DEAD/DEAH box RNA helicase family protein n=1 Tax=Prunus dulcis TaxID=3755 RepID=A0A4Y1QMR6_PRUDU|nr:DEAD/DEAH box RNA helicase family protein [Prunus dulcis]
MVDYSVISKLDVGIAKPLLFIFHSQLVDAFIQQVVSKLQFFRLGWLEIKTNLLRRRSRHRLRRHLHLIDIQLLLQELDMVLEDKPEDIDDKQWMRINLHSCAAIRKFLEKELKYSYVKETSAKELWMKLEEKYMTKSAENQLFLKKRLF